MYVEDMYKIIEKVTLKVYVHFQGGNRTESKEIRNKSAEGAERRKIPQ